MKVRLADLYNSVSSIEEIMKLQLTAKMAYTVARNARKINAALKDLDAAKNSLMESYGVISDDGNLNIPEERIEEFNNDMTELFMQEVDIDIRIITLADIDECDRKRKDFSISANLMFSTWFMFEDSMEE